MIWQAIVLVGVTLAGIAAALRGYADWVAVAAYLGATGVALWIAYRNRGAFKDLLTEKAPEVTVTTFEPPASFARLVGVIGAAMLVAFLWCYGLLMLLAVVGGASGEVYAKRLGDMDGQFRDFIYIAAALFAPYAVNQLARLLGPRMPATTDASGTPVTFDKTAAEILERAKIKAGLLAEAQP